MRQSLKPEAHRNERLIKDNEGRLERLKEQAQKVREAVKDALAILEKHRSARQKKMPAYHKHSQLEQTEPLMARAYWDKNKLGVTEDRIRNKEAEISELRRKTISMAIQTSRLGKEVSAIVEFRPIADQMEGLSVDFMNAEGGKDWEIANSKFKTYQDIFSPVGNRILPRPNGKYASTPYDRLPLKNCIVDPERIPDWLLDEFNFADLSPGLSAFEKLQMKVEAIPAVADLFEHLKPMTPGVEDNRIYGYRMLVVSDYKAEHDGKIVTPYYLGRLSREKDRKAIQVFDNAYAARRKTEHIEHGYDRERGKIFSMRGRIEDIRAELVGMPKDAPRRDEISRQLAEEVDSLRAVTNFFKIEAFDILQGVIGIKDSLGRHNPGATCAKILRALGQLQKRLPQIFEKSKHIHEDKGIISQRIEGEKADLTRCNRGFTNMGQQFDRNGSSDIQRSLGNLPDLSRLQLRPFILYGRKIQEKMAEIKAGIENKHDEKVREAIINALVITKIFQAQDTREEILREITLMPGETSLDILLRKSQRLLAVIKAREVSPSIETSYSRVYQDLEKKVEKLVNRLIFYTENPLNPEETASMYERLKKYLEDIDFEEILAKLD